MMKKITNLLAFTLLLLIKGYTQEAITLNITYEFKYVRDSAKRNNPYTASMILSVGKQQSRYCSEKLYQENDKNVLKKRAEQQARISSSPGGAIPVAGGPLLVVNKYGAIINEEIIKNHKEKKLTLNGELGFKTYQVDGTIPAIEWKVLSEKKTIDKYNCQKATGNYAGRTYEVWFTPEIPVQDGPWKLSGLPGLILEARDTKNEVSFVFKSMSKNTDPEETTRSLLASSFSIKTTLKEYNKAKAAFETDPEAVMAALAPRATITVINIDNPNAEHATKIKKYNPLELQ